jgi:hypothetical protein
MIDNKYYQANKRLEKISLEDIEQGTNMETTFGKEFVIDRVGNATVGDLRIQTISKSKVGNRNALVHTDYYSMHDDKAGYILMELTFEGEPRYKEWLERAKYVDSFNKLKENTQ